MADKNSISRLVAPVLIATLAVPTLAFAQDEGEPEGAAEASTAMKVNKQNGCNVLIQGGGKLKPNQKLEVAGQDDETATAVVKSARPNNTAIAVLDKKFCKSNFVGAAVNTSSSKNMGSSDEEFSQSGNSGQSGGLPEGVKYNSSAHNRIKYPISGRFGGGYMFFPGITFGASYNFSHEFMAELTVDSVNTNLLSLYEYSRLRIGALGSYFGGNSFFSSGGLILENFSSNLIGGKADDDGLTFDKAAFKADIMQVQAQIGIGNRWNLGRFVIGSEWVGLSLPLFNMSETYTKAEGYPDTQFESAKKSNKEFADTKSFRLLNTFIGFSF